MWTKVLLGLFLATCVVLAAFGNLLVILTVFLYKKMRSFTNLLIVSLASADLMVSTLVMPFALTDLLLGHRWIFGKIICIFFITADVCLCTASILNLLVISLDRYLAITQPLKYARRKNGRLASFLVLFVWLASLLLCAPPLLVPDWRIEFGGPSQECRYVKAIAFRVYSALGSFYIPLAIMIGLYVKIYRVVSQRENQIAVSGGSSDGSCKAEGDSRTSEKLSKKRSSIMQIWQHKKGKSANGTSYRRPPPPPPTSVHMRTSSDSGNGRYRRGRDDDQDSDVNVHAYASQQNSDRPTNKNSSYRCSDWTPINNGGTTAATTAAECYSAWCQEEDEFFELKNIRPDTSTTSKEQPSISLNEKDKDDDDEEGEEYPCSRIIHRHGSKERDSKNSFTKKDILLIHEEESTNETNEQKIRANTNNNMYSPSSKFSIIKQNRLVKFSRNCYSNFNNNKSNKRPKIERLSHTEILARKKQYSALLAELCRQYGTISGAELVAPTVKMSRTETAVVVQKKSSVYQNPFLALNGGGGGGSPMLTNLLSSHGSKLREKLLYLKERKAIKTISVVVFGFIICWLPFFVVYIAELVCDFHEPQLATLNQTVAQKLSSKSEGTALTLDENFMQNFSPQTAASVYENENATSGNSCHIPPALADIFLWLGYANSALNPLIYTFYNKDYRRCFKDILTLGFLRKQSNRRPSVRRLHQQALL